MFFKKSGPAIIINISWLARHNPYNVAVQYQRQIRQMFGIFWILFKLCYSQIKQKN